MPCEDVSAEKYRRLLREVPNDIKSYFNYLAQFGFSGIDCSEKALNTIQSWDLDAIRLSIASCNRCHPAGIRKKAVFGRGNLKSSVVFVGGCPESDDAHTGNPYSGEAGELLTKIISAMKLNRESVYITHAVKCCPLGTAEILKDHVHVCKSYLAKEINFIKPKIICALGDIAAGSLLGIASSIHRIHGKFYNHGDSKVMVTYSPEHLLKHPEDKRAAWEDIQQVMNLYASGV